MEKLVKTVIQIIHTYFFPCVGLKQIHLFKFGLSTISLPSFESLNSNARIWGSVENRSTAESKMYRLLKNETMQTVGATILNSFSWITTQSMVNVDFSTFSAGWMYPEFQVLAFGLQTQLGRAVPLFFDIIQYPIKTAGSQNIFIIQAIKKLKSILGFYPQFILDRGFAIPSLIDFFIQEGITFYVRSKSGKTLTILSMREIKDMNELDKLMPVGKIREKDLMVKVYGKPMRLVISDHDGKNKEPWYILTNDIVSPRKKIIETYYHRFEIEETCKDLKHLKNIEKIKVKSERTFNVVLWFMIIGCWLAYLSQTTYQKTKETATIFSHGVYRNIKTNAHKTLSIFRTFFEAIQRCFYFVQAYLTRRSRFR